MPLFTRTRKIHPEIKNDEEITEENKIAEEYETTTGEKYNADKHDEKQDAMTARLRKLGLAGGKTRRRSSARKQNKSKKHHKKSKKHRKKHHNKKSKKHRKK